jgi:hypothetical protein
MRPGLKILYKQKNPHGFQSSMQLGDGIKPHGARSTFDLIKLFTSSAMVVLVCHA